MIDVDALLEPVSDDAPCGVDLEYDPQFREMEEASRGKPETQWSVAEPPEWKTVIDLAEELATRTKDVRIGVILTQALAAREGFPGLVSGLKLLQGYIERYWDTLIPALDPDDDNDPTIRLNALAPLADPQALLKEIRALPFTQSRVFGRFAWRDWAIASGLETSEAETEITTSTIEGAFRDSDPEWLATQRGAVADAIEAVAALDSALGSAVGVSMGTDFKPLRKLLFDIKKLIETHSGAGGGGDAGDAPEDGGEDAPAHGGGASGGGDSRSAGGGPPGAIRNTADVVAALDKIRAYYTQNEPSSPIPMMIDRMKRLVSKDFLSIIKDLAPDGVDRFRLIAGLPDEDE